MKIKVEQLCLICDDGLKISILRLKARCQQYPKLESTKRGMLLLGDIDNKSSRHQNKNMINTIIFFA